MKHRGLLITALVASGLLLAGCGQEEPQTKAPLAYVPADTPYLFADLEVADEDTRNALLSLNNMSMERAVTSLQDFASYAEEDGATEFSNLLRTFADELEGKESYQQAISDIGLAMDEQSAFYGVGLTPVMRAGVADAEAYQAFLNRLVSSTGQSFEEKNLDDVTYDAVSLGDSPFQLVSMVNDDVSVLSITPSDLDDATLGTILGISEPEESAEDSERLNQLVDDKGYLPYALGYVDTTRLASLIGEGNDPMFQAILAADTSGDAQPLSQSCSQDLSRLAARSPEVSLGFTEIETDHITQRSDIALAEDIATPFAALESPLPGLGDESSDAPFDLALALPMDEIRRFLAGQIRSIQETPFGCQDLAELNNEVDQLAARINMLAIPPVGLLRGARVMIEDFDMPRNGKQPNVEGVSVVASSDPNGLFALAQMEPQLATLQLSDDGQATPLPRSVVSMLGMQSGWVAMNDRALGVAVGEGQDARLEELMQGSPGEPGQLMRLHMTGEMYAKWMRLIDSLQQIGKSSPSSSLDSLMAGADNLESMDITLRMEDAGLVYESRSALK